MWYDVKRQFSWHLRKGKSNPQCYVVVEGENAGENVGGEEGGNEGNEGENVDENKEENKDEDKQQSEALLAAIGALNSLAAV